MQQTRSQITRSAYSQQRPPPAAAPPGVAEVTAWELASAQWREHLPDEMLGVDCAACRDHWPCYAWDVADKVLTSCQAAAQRC